MDERYTKLLKQAEEWIEAHRDEFVSELQAMTRIPSVSRADLAEEGAPFGKECRRMLDYALERGRYYGFETIDHEGYAGSICYGDPDNAIGLFTHLDVVPAGDGWIYPPFEAVYLPEHDAVIGRGSDDNKCAAVASLFVMRMLREFGWKLRHGIRLYCGTSEETGMQDMIALREKGHQFPKLSLVPDSGFPVNYGQKGSANGDISIACEGNLIAFDAGSARNALPDLAEAIVAIDEAAARAALAKLDPEWVNAITVTDCTGATKLSAVGKSAHSASPQSGVNAIFLLARVLSESGLLEGSCKEAIKQVYELTSDFTGKNEGVSYRDDMSGDLTLVYSVAHLIGGRLEVKADCRTPITCDVVQLVENLRKAWSARGFEVMRTAYSKPYYRPKDDPYIVALQELFKEITGREDQPFVMGGGNYARVIPNAISFGPGMPTKTKISDFLPEGRGNCHGKDEAVIMEKAHNCAKIYVLAVAMIDEMMEMIRRAVSSDSLGMGKVYCLSWREAYKGIVPQDFLDQLTPEGSAPNADRISSNNSRVFEENGEIIGLVNFGVSRTPISENFGELRSIYVLPEHWDRGIGSQLFVEAKAELKEMGFDGFYLWVLRDNLRARRFYEKMGMASANSEKIDLIGGKELVEMKYVYVF